MTSPTFVLAHEYRGSTVAIAHLDFYRLTVPASRRGLDEYLDGRHITFVEWPERDRSFPVRNPIRVRLRPIGRSGRRIVISCPKA